MKKEKLNGLNSPPNCAKAAGANAHTINQARTSLAAFDLTMHSLPEDDWASEIYGNPERLRGNPFGPLAGRIMQRELRLDNEALSAVRGHARQVWPEECCGLLLGRSAGSSVIVSEVRPSQNLSHARRSRYMIDSDAMVHAVLAGRRGGADLVGFYHSHPESGTAPSSIDRREAWSGMVYLIVGLAGGQGVSFGAWFSGATGENWQEMAIAGADAPRSVPGCLQPPHKAEGPARFALTSHRRTG